MAYKTDLHMHTTVSDGSDTPLEILEKVKKAGIDVFSVTDHDAVKAAEIIGAAVTKDDPVFIPGAEFSCKDAGGKYHILGYGYDPQSPAILGVIELGHSFRMKKVTERLRFIKEEFGFSFPEEEIEKLFSLDNPGKPHIANLMVKYGYAENKKQAIDEYINRIRFKSDYVRPEQAIEGILSAGGIPVLAHPAYGSGDELILGDELDARIKRLMDFGLGGIEAFYSGFTGKLTAEMLRLAEKYGLYVTAGSDYHGANKMVTLGDTGAIADFPTPPGLTRFLERFLK